MALPGDWHHAHSSNQPPGSRNPGSMYGSGGLWPAQRAALGLAQGRQAILGNFLNSVGKSIGGGGIGGGGIGGGTGGTGGTGSLIGGAATTPQPNYSALYAGMVPPSAGGSNVAPSYGGMSAPQLAQGNVEEAGLAAYYPATTSLWQAARDQLSQQAFNRHATQLQDMLSGSRNQLLAQQPLLAFSGNLLRSILD